MNSFEELALSPALKKSVFDMGFKAPTPIQAQALPILLAAPTDFIGLAATGTGKTVAFGLPLIEQIDPKVKAIQGLIMCPTRELAMQVTGQINLIGKNKGVKAVCIYGGSGYSDQLYALRHGTPVIVGTPGRLVDHLERGTMDLSNLKTLILDEADEMISMGFKEDLEKIMSAAPENGSHAWLFSATMDRNVRKVADHYLRNPKTVQVNRTEIVPTQVEQVYFATRESNKPEVLCKIIDAAEDFYGIIFCQTKLLVTDLMTYLTEKGYKVDCLHGDKDQRSRERTTQAFRDKRIQILICTDVASRGLDVKDVTHVINYSIPRELESYVHRIGRTARSGKKGIAVSLVTPSHRHLIPQIERITNSRIKEGVLPTRKDIGSKKSLAVLEQFKTQAQFEKALELVDGNWKDAIMHMTKEEIIARFFMVNFPDLFIEKERSKVAHANENGFNERPKFKQRREGQFEGRGRRGAGRFEARHPSSHKPYRGQGGKGKRNGGGYSNPRRASAR